MDAQIFLTFLISFILRVLNDDTIRAAEPLKAEFYGWVLLSSMALLLLAGIALTAAQVRRRRKFRQGLAMDAGLMGVVSGAMGALGGAVGYALIADAVACAGDSNNAARDYTILQTLSANIPGMIVPYVCGSLVTEFGFSYRLFWGVAGVFSILSLCALFVSLSTARATTAPPSSPYNSFTQ